MITRHPCLARLPLAPLALLASAAFSLGPLLGRVFAVPAPGPPADAHHAPAHDPQLREREERQHKRVERAHERERKAQNLRHAMSSLGFDDRTLQDEILLYIGGEVRARGQVRRKAQEIYAALRDPGKSDADVRALLAQYQAVVQADRTRRREAEDGLNDRIGFRSKPRLEAMLVLFGVVGDAPFALPPAARSAR